MRILVTGGCGCVGSAISRRMIAEGHEVVAMDSLRRDGAATNVESLREIGVKFVHGDVRNYDDFAPVDPPDWIVDAAAEPSVIASHDALMAHNVLGTVNTIRYARECRAGLVFISTSRVYSIKALNDRDPRSPIGEKFPTTAPVSLYGATKLAGEILAAESIPNLIINRCGTIAGGGQFGHQGQGVFSWWIRSYRDRKPLAYTGYGGMQIRDILHPRDLARLVAMQIEDGRSGTYNVGGGPLNAVSLRDVSAWCAEAFGHHPVANESATHKDDVFSVIMDWSKAGLTYGWAPEWGVEDIFSEIAAT